MNSRKYILILVLHEKPDDELAFRCKIISSIHLSKIDEALSFMDKNPKLLGYKDN